MKAAATAFASGLLFGGGLLLSGMADPRNVLGFLDIFGDWDPRLAAVMAGALGVHAWLLRLGQRLGGRPAGIEPRQRRVDAPLVLGAAIFGIGWGLSGYCPGPAVVSLFRGGWQVALFLVAMLAGTWLADAFLVRRFGRALARE